MIDTHTHIQFKIFDQNRDQVIEDAKSAGVEKIIAVGTDLESSKKAVELAQIYPDVFASVGIHPHHMFGYQKSEAGSQNIIEEIEKLLYHPKVVAIGETGMDKHDYPNTKYKDYKIHADFLALQKELFGGQIKLAIKYQKSLIIHNRQAVEETLEILEKNWDKFLEGWSVFHCCEPDKKLLDFAKEYGIFIGIDGDVTYDSAKQKFIKHVPLELLVLETDSPFLAPKSIEFPNTPANLKLVASKIAEIKKVEQKEIEKITFENSQRLFSLI